MFVLGNFEVSVFIHGNFQSLSKAPYRIGVFSRLFSPFLLSSRFHEVVIRVSREDESRG